MAAPQSPRPKKSGNRKGSPPKDDQNTGVVGNNIQKAESADLVPLNFKVDPEFKKDYKTFASMHDISMVTLLKMTFELYKSQNGS